MSILGVVIRSRPESAGQVKERLSALPGVELADQLAEDGRCVIVIEDTALASAAATMASIALWTEVLNTSLVYEYSGPDSPAPDALNDYRDWRRGSGAPTPTDPGR